MISCLSSIGHVQEREKERERGRERESPNFFHIFFLFRTLWPKLQIVLDLLSLPIEVLTSSGHILTEPFTKVCLNIYQGLLLYIHVGI
jgi:hypothetical protein